MCSNLFVSDNYIFVLLMLRKERTTYSDALVILAEMSAHNERCVHVYTKIRFHKIDGCQDGQIGIALATSWATHLGNLT